MDFFFCAQLNELKLSIKIKLHKFCKNSYLIVWTFKKLLCFAMYSMFSGWQSTDLYIRIISGLQLYTKKIDLSTYIRVYIQIKEHFFVHDLFHILKKRNFYLIAMAEPSSYYMREWLFFLKWMKFCTAPNDIFHR